MTEQPGVYLLYRVFVPWSGFDPNTGDDIYVDMSNDAAVDILYNGNTDSLDLVGGWVVGRENGS